MEINLVIPEPFANERLVMEPPLAEFVPPRPLPHGSLNNSA